VAPSPEGVTCAVGCDVTGEEETLRRKLRSERLAAVETLVAGLAHELRNPLNSAALQLQVLRRRLARPDGGSPSVEPILASIDEEIARLERLVSEFLSFVQPRPLALRRMEVEDLFKGVLAAAEADANAAGIATSYDIQPDLPVAHSDPERLRHVLQHLVRNAVEAMPAGGRLELRARRAADGQMVEIDVADTGHGFSDQAPIFDAFFTTKPNGTGLGLAIVHRIVSDHGGTIHVRSKPGETCFTIALPTRAP
jgi:signal transduction histidine kinase